MIDTLPWLKDGSPIKDDPPLRWNIWRFVDAVWGGAETFAEASRIARGGTNDG